MGIVMLTSAGAVVDRIVDLEMGADDYLPKPFDPRELLARIKSVLRRAAGSVDLGASRVRVGRCVLDLDAHRLIEASGAEVPMSPSNTTSSRPSPRTPIRCSRASAS